MSDLQTFEIRTLQDIYNLPTIEQMETCLSEMTTAMIQARLANDMMVSLISEKSPEVTRAIEWPEVSRWSDDGKGEIAMKIKHEGETVMEINTNLNQP